MIIPIRHDKMSARRWPIVTLALIVVNLAIFASTHRLVDRQDSELWTVREHILILSATHPDLVLPPDISGFVSGFQKEFSNHWAEFQNHDFDTPDEWDARIRWMNNLEDLQAEMNSLGKSNSKLAAASITEQYSFVPARSKPITYLTSTFLHADWWHVLGNMWFLWLAGFVLEDAWGRPLYLLVYLAAGAMACHFNALMRPESIIHSVGASGAIAGLMGAFLIRFPLMRIRMMWFFDLGVFSFSRFWMRAYWLLPFWVLVEINSGMGPRDGVGHWAHVGGFLFGAVAAVGLRYSGLERKMDQAIEQRVTWTPEAPIAKAHDLMEGRQLDEAASVLNHYLAANPESFEAWNLLRAVYWQGSDIPAYREATGKLCGLHLKAREHEAAWQDYEDFLNAGGETMPPRVWLDLCRLAEERQDFGRAACEYERLAIAHVSEREAIMARISAARICLKHLDSPQEALRHYEIASASAVPHLDLERDIDLGIQEVNLR